MWPFIRDGVLAKRCCTLAVSGPCLVMPPEPEYQCAGTRQPGLRSRSRVTSVRASFGDHAPCARHKRSRVLTPLSQQALRAAGAGVTRETWPKIGADANRANPLRGRQRSLAVLRSSPLEPIATGARSWMDRVDDPDQPELSDRQLRRGARPAV
jgi:hypothetical protein